MTAQEAAGAAESAAATSASKLSAALDAAANAAKRAASLPVNSVAPLAEAADVATKGAARAATEAAARAADVTAKRAAAEAAADAAKHGGAAERFAAQAAATDRAWQEGGLFGIKKVLPTILRVADAVNPLLDFYSAVEIGQARMEREHQVVGRNARQNGGVRTYADETHGHYDPSYLEHDNAETAARVYDRAIADRRAINRPLGPRDEGTRAQAAYQGVQVPAGLPQPAPPQKVDVTSTVRGTVEGKADVKVGGEFTLQPSQWFLGAMKKVEGMAAMVLHGDIGGGSDMNGPNGVTPSVTPGQGGHPGGI